MVCRSKHHPMCFVRDFKRNSDSWKGIGGDKGGKGYFAGSTCLECG